MISSPSSEIFSEVKEIHSNHFLAEAETGEEIKVEDSAEAIFA